MAGCGGFAEEFDSELERLNVSLVLENQSLQAENRQLSGLLKDYEGTLEAVMAKFRAHAVRSDPSHPRPRSPCAPCLTQS